MGPNKSPLKAPTFIHNLLEEMGRRPREAPDRLKVTRGYGAEARPWRHGHSYQVC